MAYQFTQSGDELQNIADLAENNIATEYDPTASYFIGEYCAHEGALYRCAASTSGNWDAAKWEEVTVMGELSSSGTWTPTVSRADVSTSAGRYVKIGTVVFLQAMIAFSPSQSARGNIYIDANSLPSALPASVNIHGAGATDAASFSLSNYANKNIWIAKVGAGRIQATDSSIEDKTVYFSMTVVPR